MAGPPALAAPCLWDSDTLAAEAKGLPGIAEILTGRIERQPPRYYEMRLARVTASLAEHPERLEDYDDAAVACDRLQRSGDAIEWMNKKRVTLDRLATPSSEHEYRYHANIGTFLAHRWIRAGANRADLTDLKAAEEHIAKAIEINPEAHFGREKYQLAAIRWLLEGPDTQDGADYRSNNLTSAQHSTSERGDGVAGLAGLIVLGDAWQSVDVHWALGSALTAHGDASLAHLAELRVRELVGSGGKSFSPAFELDEILPFHGGQPYSRGVASIDAFFSRARKAADEWAAARTAYMESQFALGKHPDTHPDFWTGWKEMPPPALPDPVFTRLGWGEIAGIGIGTAVVLGVGAFLVIRRRRRVAA